MFIQYYHRQHIRSTDDTSETEIPQNKHRQLTPDKSSWPIAEPSPPPNQTTNTDRQPNDSTPPTIPIMGCAPSRPNRSFYNDYFVEQPRPRTKQVRKQRRHQPPQNPHHRQFPPPQPCTAPGKRPVTIAEVKFAEAVARGNLRIYEEEVLARKRAMDKRTFVMHAAMRGNELVF